MKFIKSRCGVSMSVVKNLFYVPEEYHTDGEVGIEIEVEGSSLPSTPKWWDVTSDSSLRGSSCEYVLKKPIHRKQVTESLAYLQSRMTSGGARLRNSIRCGVHVHINVQELNLVELFNFICTYMILEEILVRKCGPYREGNLFCLRTSDAELILEFIQRGLRDIHDMPSYLSNDNIRYASINLNSLSKFGSLEFRALATPNDMTEISMWVDTLIKIKDFSRTFSNPRAIIESFSEAQYEEFVKNVLEELYPEYVKVGDINNLARNGMRNAQEVAYSMDWDAYQKSLKNRVFSVKSSTALRSVRNLRLRVNPETQRDFDTTTPTINDTTLQDLFGEVRPTAREDSSFE